jgi:hypothetical protein
MPANNVWLERIIAERMIVRVFVGGEITAWETEMLVGAGYSRFLGWLLPPLF